MLSGPVWPVSPVRNSLSSVSSSRHWTSVVVSSGETRSGGTPQQRHDLLRVYVPREATTPWRPISERPTC